ncbi:hypothetical protein BDP27DRAFT_1403012 [Rhodocollybia butyracea]|uniref:F-box domain-containing protein n=1 Tax=Rhodocollybia butyracea TaxID=206335 RepID=A0A9P5PMX6_9AGAR|nr:hypothetical protein BDP27DRAFT_1403012 [Rhodocollybia butyracea]
MSEANVPSHSQLDSKSLTSTHPPTHSSLESTYQALYAEFLTKSRQNDIPNSPVVRDRLRALIAQTRSDLLTWSESTTCTCSQISRVLELQESLLAPIRTLPSDVLTKIFQLVIETSDEPEITYSSWKYTKLSGCIFLFTWVCFWWRDEALSNSIFWSRIAVYDESSEWDAPPTTSEVAAFLYDCILRSGVSAPLSIKISISLRRGTCPPAVTTMLAAQAHRWRQVALSVDMRSDQIGSLFPFKPSSTHFPLLEDLSFRCYGPNIDAVQNPILAYYPPLQKLELDDLSESYADVIGSRNLKVLKLGCYSGVSLARLLDMCPCLEFLKLGSFSFTASPNATKQITCQSSLLTLDIHGDMVNGLWKGVTLPELTKLHVKLPDFGGWHEADVKADTQASLSELKDVLKRSGCALQHVNLVTDSDREEWGMYLLPMMEKFFEDLPAKAVGCFVEGMPLQEWMKWYLK